MVALKAEAQAFVDKFKLNNYENDNIKIIVTGMGSSNMYDSTCRVVQGLENDDIIVNIGICGADIKFHIGQLIDAQKNTLTCSDTQVSKQGNYELVDMESAGFLKATLHVQNSYIFKVVSDHFEPRKVTKDRAKAVIFNVIDEIMEKLI
ncbi:MAG: hypothetical protein U9N33_12510 [Campylobacterota bacterium]|nr:hypothetical protein [Campylobacterota bacterium]